MKRWFWKRWVWAVLVGTTAAVGLSVAQPRGTDAPPAVPKSGDTISLKFRDGPDRQVKVLKSEKQPDGSYLSEVRDVKTGETFTLVDRPGDAPASAGAPVGGATKASPKADIPRAKDRASDPLLAPTRDALPPAQSRKGGDPLFPPTGKAGVATIPTTPAPSQPEEKPGLLKRLFGRNKTSSSAPSGAAVTVPAPATTTTAKPKNFESDSGASLHPSTRPAPGATMVPPSRATNEPPRTFTPQPVAPPAAVPAPVKIPTAPPVPPAVKPVPPAPVAPPANVKPTPPSAPVAPPAATPVVPVPSTPVVPPVAKPPVPIAPVPSTPVVPPATAPAVPPAGEIPVVPPIVPVPSTPVEAPAVKPPVPVVPPVSAPVPAPVTPALPAVPVVPPTPPAPADLPSIPTPPGGVSAAPIVPIVPLQPAVVPAGQMVVVPGDHSTPAGRAMMQDIQPHVAALQAGVAPSQRALAARALSGGRHASTDAVKAVLFQAARNDPAAVVRCVCIEELTRLGYYDPAFLAFLHTACDDASAEVKAAAKEATAKMTPRR